MTRLGFSSFFAAVLLALVAVAPLPASAQTDGIGVGASIGVTNSAVASDRNPVGLTGKGWITDRQAIAAMTSFFIGGTQSLGRAGQSYWILQGDYLFHNFNELQIEEGFLALYVGGGAQFTVFEDARNQFALRAPIGAEYMLGSAPVDIFVEVAPTLNVTDPASLRFDGAIGFRYFFSSGTAE